MSDEFEGRERIELPEQFEAFIQQGRDDFTGCVFLFRFAPYHCRSLVTASKKKPYALQRITFVEDVLFHDISIPEDIALDDLTFKKALSFSGTNFSGNFRAERCIFHDIQFIGCSFKNKRLLLLRNQFLGKLKISQIDGSQRKNESRRNNAEKVKIGSLLFFDNMVATGNLFRFGYLDVDNFYFGNINNPVNSEINIGECDFNNFAISNLRNQGKFKIYGINVEKTQSQREIFALMDSSFADSEFKNVNLACYKKVYIQDSLFSDLKYTGVHWPNDLETNPPDDLETDPSDAIKKKQDTYRILKNVARQNNDAPQAIVFYAKEMEAYSRTLSWKREEIIDKCILWLNQKTNNFGLNWVRPIGLIFVAGIVLYGLLVRSLCLDIGNWDHWTKFPVFLIPTHKAGIEFIAGQWGFLAYSIDLVFRLIETTLIYQTIIAFRKFTRKL